MRTELKAVTFVVLKNRGLVLNLTACVHCVCEVTCVMDTPVKIEQLHFME